jgi:hypothetical protein
MAVAMPAVATPVVATWEAALVARPAVVRSAVATSARPSRAWALDLVYGPAFRSSSRTWRPAPTCSRSCCSSVRPRRLPSRAAYSLPHMIHVQFQTPGLKARSRRGIRRTGRGCSSCSPLRRPVPRRPGVGLLLAAYSVAVTVQVVGISGRNPDGSIYLVAIYIAASGRGGGSSGPAISIPISTTGIRLGRGVRRRGW